MDLSSLPFAFFATLVVTGLALVLLAVVANRHREAARVWALVLGVLGVPPLFYAFVCSWTVVVEGRAFSTAAGVAWTLWALCWGAAALVVHGAVRRATSRPTSS